MKAPYWFKLSWIWHNFWFAIAEWLKKRKYWAAGTRCHWLAYHGYHWFQGKGYKVIDKNLQAKARIPFREDEGEFYW